MRYSSVFIVLALLGVARPAASSPDPVQPVAAAVRAACHAVFGRESDVDIVLGMVSPADVDGVVATVAPGGRVGQPSRFLLWRGARQVGYAVATVEITAEYLKPVRAIARDEVVDKEAVVVERGRLPQVPFLRLPGRLEVVGASARRALVPGEPILNGLIVEVPAVRTGETVQAHLTRGALEISARAVASGTGRVGDVIRVRAIGAERMVAARITAPGAVEIQP